MALLLALISALAVAGPARAGDDDSSGAGACVFDGNAGQAPTPVQSIFDDIPVPDGGVLDPLALLDTDGATFTFGGAASCLAADVAGESVGVATPAAGPFALSAVGRFTNLICGTGQAQGTAAFEQPGEGTLVTAKFAITFVAGVGVIEFADADGELGLNVSTHPDPLETEDIDTGEGDGVVNIIPDSQNGGGNCIDEDVTEFIVNGAFTFRFSGDAQGN